MSRLSALVDAEGPVYVTGLRAGGWSWSETAVYYKPDAGRFYWLDEGGCSCNYFGEGDYTLGDFSDGDRDAAPLARIGLPLGGRAERRRARAGRLRSPRLPPVRMTAPLIGWRGVIRDPDPDDCDGDYRAGFALDYDGSLWERVAELSA